MSPEQWGELPRDGNSDIDGRADIYSLGVVLYEIIAGQRPYAATTLSEMRRQHVSARPRLLHEFVPNVGERFSLAVARAMSKDRGDRQATTGELAAELKAALLEDPVGVSVAASMPMPDPGGPTAAVVEQRGAGVTAVERGMPTVVTSGPLSTHDRFVTSGPDSGLPNYPSEAATMPTVISAPIEDAAPAGRPAAEKPAETIQPPRVEKAAAGGAEISSMPPRRSPFVFVGVGIIILLLVAGVGGFALLKFRNPPPVNVNTSPHTDPDLTDPAVTGHEIGRYWFGVNLGDNQESNRFGDTVAIPSGRKFKFHFSPDENGYLYIVGPDKKNMPAMFLAAKQIPETGLKTNEVKSGVDFIFPADTNVKANWIELDETVGTDEYTVVFSPTPISDPAFFAGPSGSTLTAEEVKQWQQFQTQVTKAVTGEAKKTGSATSLPVKIPQNSEGKPAIFQFRIDHKPGQ
jgi:hypothetical protein